jgi:DNA-binding CsgD family transcriptional regulator/tetratricopeptide (TPR) repeat protein
MATAAALERARAAFGTHHWAEARAGFTAADQAAPLDAEDLERLAICAFLTGADAVSIDAWTRAHHQWLQVHHVPRAARCAFWMVLELFASAERARANGWLATARRLLNDGGHDCPERGLLAVLVVRGHLAQGDDVAAHEAAVDAVARADRFDDPDLKAFGRLAGGLVHARRGEVRAAVALFDEAMVAVTTGDVSPITIGIVYCAVIEACYEVLDIGRAREWTAALARWCDAHADLVPFRGHCLVHRAETLRLCGAWSSAAGEAGHACQRESLDGPIGAAYYELAEIHRMRGEFAEAEEAYRQANLHGRSPEPGLALLRLAEGRAEIASTAIRRALDLPQRRWARANVLAASVEVMVRTGALDIARVAARELTAMAADLPAPFLRAVAAQAEGTVRLAENQAREALDPLRRAWMEWQELEVPFEAARVRVLMGLACRQLADDEAAQMEFDAARHVFLRLGAAPEVARVDRLIASSPAPTGPRLTARELQIIKLLAAGRTNRDIARQLAISERTVDRHVSNILTKLDLPSRSAATAYAYQHDLV